MNLKVILVLGFLLVVIIAVYAATREDAEPPVGYAVRFSTSYDESFDQGTRSSAPAQGANATAGGRLSFRFASPDHAAILAERGESGDLPVPDEVRSGELVNTTSPERRMVTLDANGTAMLRLDSKSDWVMALRFTSVDVWRPPPPGVCDEGQSLYFATPMLHFVPVREAISEQQVTVPFGAICTGP